MAGGKGFAFSLDAAVAVVIVISAIVLFTTLRGPAGVSYSQTAIVDDALFALEQTGYIIETLDDLNSPTADAGNIRCTLIGNKNDPSACNAGFSGFLPAGFDANISISRYVLDMAACASGQTFETCFGDANATGASGSPPQATADIVSGKKYFVRKQPPGDCNISYASLSRATEGELFEWEPMFPQPAETALLAEDANVDFSVVVDPSTAITCDQDVSVTLSVSVPENFRKPIDLMLVVDKSGSMSWNGILDMTSANDVYVSGQYAYVADGSSGLRVVDAQAPTMPSLSGTYNSPGTAVSVFVDGSYAYLADSGSGLRVVNVSNPALPSSAGVIDPGTVVDVHGEAGSDYVFAVDTSSTDEFLAINKSDPANMAETDQLNFNSVRKLFVDSGYAYLAARDTSGDNYDLHIIDVSDPSDLNYVAEVNMSDARAVHVLGNYAYVADGAAGLKIVDISNPAAASVVGTYNTPGTAYEVVAYSDGNAYVADNTSLQAINVANPAAPAFSKSYSTPYSYTGLDISAGWAFMIPGYNTSLTIFNIYDGPKMDIAKDAASGFVDFNGWSFPPDQMGLVSFNDNNTLDQQLTSNPALVQAAISAITSGGGTDMADGINGASAELNGVRHNPNAKKFQVLLSDGVSSTNPANAADAAEANDIIIFTIGFGGDADEAQLQDIADRTDGNYYFAEDENALQEVFNLIATRVGELANDSNVSVPVFSGSTIVDLGGGVIVDANIIFDAGSITVDTPWTATYTLNFPCDNANICGIEALTFPGPGTTFNYTDSDGNYHSVDFNVSTSPIAFYSRDLRVDITGGEVVGSDDVVLDILVENVRELDANETTLRLYLDDTTGAPVMEIPVPALCSADTPSCTLYAQPFSQMSVNREGVIYATINDDNSMSECPAGNVDAVYCYGGPETEIYVVEYMVWRQ